MSNRKTLTDDELLQRREDRNAARRVKYADEKARIEALQSKAKINRTLPIYSSDENALLKTLRIRAPILSGRKSAIAQHVLETVDCGKPFKGWQDDVREVLGIPA